MGTIEAIGALFHVVGSADGVHIDLTNYGAVTYVCSATSGNQVIALKESVAGASEQALPVIDTLWKTPRTGGTWTEVTQTASDSYTHSDGTNNCVAFTVHAGELSDGFTSIEATFTNELTALAILWSPAYPRDPSRVAIVNVT